MPRRMLKSSAAAAAAALAQDAYKDALHVPATDVGVVLHHVGSAMSETVRTALRPYHGVLWSLNQAFDWVATRAEQILNARSVPLERIRSAPPQIEAGVLQGIQWSGPLEDRELREMFASLLATALDSATTDIAHPAFAEILRQITPDEAKILQLITDRHAAQIYKSVLSMEAAASSKAGSYAKYAPVLRDAVSLTHPDAFPAYQDNLLRLGLFDVEHSKDERLIAMFQSDDVNRALIRFEDEHACSHQRRAKIRYNANFVNFSGLGRSFMTACIQPTPGIVPRGDISYKVPLRARR